MAISDTQKLDYLWKKVGYGIAKTDTDVAKKAYEETISSPLLLRGDRIWQQSADIPGTKPSTTTGVVKIYKDNPGSWTQTVECTEDLTATDNKSWKTNLTDWISVEFGTSYLVEVYIDNTGSTTPQSTGTKIFAAGSGNNDEWFFDYQAGVLHFIGANLPTGIASGVTGKSIYVSGARYIGLFGISTTATINTTSATLGNLNISDITITSVNSNDNIIIDPNGSGNVQLTANTNVTGILNVSGNIIAGNANLGNAVTANFYVGNGYLLTGVQASGGAATTAVTVTANAQPNITSVGRLSSLVVGNATANTTMGNGTIDATGNITAANANLGNLVVANYFSGDGSLLTGLRLDTNLVDVSLTTPTNGQLLGYNGVNWVNVNNTGGVSAGAGVDFFFTGPQLIAQNGNNYFQIDSLSIEPNATQSTMSMAINNTTAVIVAGRYNVALNRTQLDGGVWDFTVYANVDSTGGTTQISTGIWVIENPSQTYTTTGTGTSRTATASGGTPFAGITASADIRLASYLRTAHGLYQITSKTSDTVVTIATPSTYTNETNSAGAVANPYVLSGWQTITSTSLSLFDFIVTASTRVVNTTDTIGWLLFGSTTNNKTIYTTMGGTTNATHITTPFATSHNDLAGLQGGQASEYYHLTNSEYTGTGTGDFVRKTSPQLVTPNIDSATGTSLSLTGNVSAANAALGNAVSANYFVGDGSLLTGLAAATTATTAYKLANGTSNVDIPTINGNITVGVSGNTNIAIFTGTGVNVNGYLTVTGTSNVANVNATGNAVITGNITSSNANLGNLVTANYFSGNAHFLTGVIDNANYAAYAGNVTIATQSNITSLGRLVDLTVGNATSNITMGNGNITAAGDVIITSTTNSTSTSSGALTVVGGIGTAGNIYAGGNISATDINGANLTLSGNLVVNGATTYINSTVTRIVDPIIELGGGANGTTLSSDDGKDRGSLLHYYDGAAVNAFMGWDNSNSEFAFGSDVSVASEVVTFNTYGNLRAGYLFGNGTYLTGVSAASTSLNIANGTSNVSIPVLDGNVTFGVSGNANVMVVTGTGANINGSLDVTGNVIFGSTANAIVTNDSSDLNTGAVQIKGGASVTGNLNVGGILQVIGSITATGTVNSANSISANGTHTGTTTFTGPTVFSSGITANTSSSETDYANGAIVITGSGALGVGGNVNIGQNLGVSGDGYIQGNLHAYSDATFDAPVVINDSLSALTLSITGTNTATSSSTGALTVAGGVGIQGNLYVGSKIDVSDIANLTIPGGTAGYILSTDGYGVLSWVDPVGTTVVGSVSTSVFVDTFTGDGANVNFTLANPVTGNDKNLVTVNYNGASILRSEYSISGNVITFTSAPALGADLEVTTFQALNGVMTFDTLSTSNLSVTGQTTFQQSSDVVRLKTGASGTVTHDFNTGAVFYHSGATSDFTCNITNVPTTNNRTSVVALIINQGGTAYLPTALQIDGVSQTINWYNAVTPSGHSNKIDIVSFTLLRVSSSWTVLAQVGVYGQP